MKRKLKGFTLVELVIVIAIVIILSVVSVPIYRGYTRNAKLSEGYALLGMILSAQKAYYSQYGRFLYFKQSSSGSQKWTANEEVLGIDARSNRYFTCFSVCLTDNSFGDDSFAAWTVQPEDIREIPQDYALGIWYNVTEKPVFKKHNNEF